MFYCKKNRYRRSLYCIVRDYLKFALKHTTTWLLLLGIMAGLSYITGSPMNFGQLAVQAALGAWFAYMLLILVVCVVAAGADELDKVARRMVMRTVIDLTCLYGIIGLLAYCC